MVSVDPEDVAVFIHESVVKGHHIYKETWTPSVGEVLLVQQELENPHDRRAVCILKSSTIVGHVPRELSRVFWFFISHGGTISCEITGHRKRGKGLEVPCLYKFTGSERMITKMKGILRVKNCHSHYC